MNGTTAKGRIVSLIRNATAKIAPRTIARQIDPVRTVENPTMM